MGIVHAYRAVAGVEVTRLTREGLPSEPEEAGISLMLDEAGRLHLAIEDELYLIDRENAEFLSRALAHHAGEVLEEED